MPFNFFNRRPAEQPESTRLEFSFPVDISAAGDTSTKKPRLRIVANTGKEPMGLDGHRDPVIVDFNGIEFDRDRLPIIADHDPSLRVGHSVKQFVTDEGIIVDAEVSSSMNVASGIVEDLRAGFPFSASIGAEMLESEFIPGGDEVEVNGETHEGPLLVARRVRIKEVSIVTIGADRRASVSVAATSARNKTMPQLSSYRSQRAEEETRIDTINAAVSRFNHLQAVNVDGRKLPMSELKATAIREGWDGDRVELLCRRTDYGSPSGPGFMPVVDDSELLECAVARHAGIRIEGHFKPDVCEVSDKVPITCLMDAARIIAQKSGRAFNPRNADEVLRASYSTSEFPNLLANIANKSVLEIYKNFPSTARLVAKKLDAKNFHEHTGVRLGGDTQFQPLAGDAELKHTVLTDEGFKYRIGTFGRMWGIDRQSIINDDTQALSDVPKVLARGAFLALEECFWNVVLSNPGAFFSVGNGNLISGAGSELSGDSLASAVQAFLEATDSEGKPIGVLPKFLIVPPALKAQADQLYTSRTFNAGGGSTTGSDRVPNANPFHGLYEPVPSPWIGSKQAASGGSDTHWFLFGDKSDVAPFGLAFLHGNEVPTIEPCDLPSHQLGVGFRGYWDFGACAIEPAGAVKSTGA